MRRGARITPVATGLSTPPMVRGVDFRLVVIIMIGTVMFTMFLKTVLIPIFGFTLFFVFKQMNKNDPMLMTIIQPYSRQGSHYFPFGKFKTTRYKRPYGFGRGIKK